jgi:hypothetical protein
MSESIREIFETQVLESIENIHVFSNELSDKINKYKDGSFGMSSIGFALYSNGYNLRGESRFNKAGLVFEDGESIFSIGFFSKELETEDNVNNYVFIVSPRGKDVLQKVSNFIDELKEKVEVNIEGYYIRFLHLDQYIEFINNGFLPIKENPWHPESPEEDETFTNALLDINKLITLNGDEIKINKVTDTVRSKNSRKKAKDGFSRFNNFLDRNNSKFEIRKYDKKDRTVVKDIIVKHFELLESKGKNIGSTPEDHFNSFQDQFTQLDETLSYVGFLDEKPVSTFIGEKVGEDTLALYTTFTLRDEETVFAESELKQVNTKGFTAMPVYAYLMLFANLLKEGISKVHLGGSELADLNRFKRQLGGKNMPTYWVFKR